MNNYTSYFPVSELTKPNNPGFKCKEDFLVDPNAAITSNIVQQHNNLERIDMNQSDSLNELDNAEISSELDQSEYSSESDYKSQSSDLIKENKSSEATQLIVKKKYK